MFRTKDLGAQRAPVTRHAGGLRIRIRTRARTRPKGEQRTRPDEQQRRLTVARRPVGDGRLPGRRPRRVAAVTSHRAPCPPSQSASQSPRSRCPVGQRPGRARDGDCVRAKRPHRGFARGNTYARASSISRSHRGRENGFDETRVLPGARCPSSFLPSGGRCAHARTHTHEVSRRAAVGGFFKLFIFVRVYVCVLGSGEAERRGGEEGWCYTSCDYSENASVRARVVGWWW